MSACPGTYALILYNDESRTVAIGKLGEFNFSRGYYVYTGSAFGPGGLAARLSAFRQLTTPVTNRRS